ncbi:dynein heavy chain, putative [Bodo saltans]|uniref:Dynein heavy chain, putative n=1 Tax=Bodo saltans TaxID=75058 RepID=A0A0S4JCE3_BODSA|nr:dynein heavy chain, putative [Bodo saltans]|eukprot:CUG85918.1 dynein heavy chain, putative [Bodo saltans]
MSGERTIKDLVEVVPEALLEGKTEKEKFEISRGFRALARLKEQEAGLTTQAYLKSAPAEQKIPKPQRRIPQTGHSKSIVKVNVPKALVNLRRDKSAVITTSSGLSPKRLARDEFGTVHIDPRSDLATVEMKGSIKNASPSERIALLYTPTANVRTTGRNDVMCAYEYQISYRNVDVPPPPQDEASKASGAGVAGKDPALSHFLPLDEFDNLEFELHAPQAWIELGTECGGTPARSKYHTESDGDVWTACRVTSYDETTNAFRITWNHNGKQKWVKRLNLIFEEEDELMWQERVAQAEELRQVAETNIRLHLYVESIDDNVITPVDEDQVDRILGLVAGEFPLHHLHVVEECIAEMRHMYSVGLKKAVHNYHFRNPVEQKRLGPLCLPAPDADPIHSLNRLLGTIDTPSPNFLGARTYVGENLFTTHALLYDTLLAINVRWRQFENGLLCDTKLKGIALPCELHIFEDSQNKCGSFVSERLREDWSSNVNTTIQNDLDTHFNFYEESMERFVESRMFRFFRMVNIAMSSQLRQLLVATITSYTDFLQRYKVVFPEGFDQQADIVEELGTDTKEREYWEQKAADILERRAKEKALREAAKPQERKKKKPVAEVNPDNDESVRPAGEEGAPEEPSALEFPFVRNEIPYSRCIVDKTQNPNGLRPLFVIRLISNGDSVMFSPLLEEVEDKVKGVFDNFFTYSDNIKGIGDQLFPLLALPPVILKPLDQQEVTVVACKEAIHEVIASNMEGPLQLQRMYQPFEYILKTEIDELVESFTTRKPAPTLDDFDVTLERLRRDMERIRSRTLNEVKFELIRVECEGVKNSLLGKAYNIMRSIMDLLAQQLADDTQTVSAGYKNIFTRVGFEPTTPEELQELKNFIDTVPDQMTKLTEMFQRITEGNDIFLKYKYLTQYDDFVGYWDAFEWPRKVQQQLEDSEFRLKEYRNTFQTELRENCEQLSEDINTLAAQVETFSRVGDDARADEYYEHAKMLDKKLKQYQADIIKYNSREQLFGLPTTQWAHIKEIKTAFEPYYHLWEVASNFNAESERWQSALITALTPKDIDNQVTEWSKKMAVVSKKIKEEAPAEVVRKVRENIERFKPLIPLIYALRSNLQASHWKNIFQICGVDQGKGQQQPGSEVKPLNEYIKMGMLDHIIQIESIATTAKKTFELESELTGMENEWKKLCFEMEPYLDTFKLKASEIMQQVLDENILKTQSILSKPILRQAQNVQTRAFLWAKQLDNIQNTLDEWFKCQNTWAYLEPIFSSADIARSLPHEKGMFTVIDEAWHKIMDVTRQTPQVIARCQDETLLKTLSESNINLEHILRKLQQFLETKRMSFPRFYFISNEELLQILSNSKDPYLVQPYLAKCFEGIKRIHFQDSLDITAMESPEGEVVQFCKKVNPTDHNNMVELWLGAVEEVMAESIRDHLRRSREDYPNRKRTEFIRHWPGQIVIAICSVYWTMEATEAMVSDATGLQGYAEKCTAQLDDLILLVRDRDLKHVERCTLEALVVIEVHARDIIIELADKGIDNPNAFDWLAQLRYYWEDGNLDVRQINASLRYGYEYLGNTGRLVITQLTDRCYRTLMGALHLNYGGAPEGPAGTGKTETTKDLAKALGKYCVVYNCSDQITSKDMAKLFKGLSQSGSWGCFDEFNRIEVQVLSVIAQQVATIQDAIALKKTEFIFEGAQIRLKHGTAVFITMNPGYAGRAELPDNLKALFRPVAMMVPNYAMIGQIQLYSYGFLIGKVLAEKIVATYRLCSEQLSSQDHYDYGMRAVKAVLTAAGRLKRQYPDEDEMILMLRSIQDVNLPKFLAQDVELFKGIISDLFPGVTLPAPDYGAMRKALSTVCDEMNLQLTEYFDLKVFQTYEMIVVRHGMMLVGLSFGGKTKVLQSLSKALGLMKLQKLEEKTRLITMNPKAITMGQLYGKVDQSGEWNDGVLSNAFRSAGVDTTPDRKWLVLDGPVDAVWIENMNTVLDDNKKLCLQNGDIIPMSKSMNMIFEVQDLSHASPATVSRCGMVYVEPDTLGWQCLMDSYLNTVPEFVTSNETYMTCLKGLIEHFMQPMLEVVRKNTATAIPQGGSVSVASFIKLFNTFIKEFDFSETGPREYEDKDVIARLEGWFLFSLTWSVGGCLYNKDRITFNTHLVDLINTVANKDGFKITLPLPENKRTFYDVCFEWTKECRFVDWLDTIPDFHIPEGSEYQEIIVPTADTAKYTYLVNTFIANMCPALLVGDTGTGKTIMMKAILTLLPKETYPLNMIQFSAQTSANDAQKMLDNRCEKRRKGVYGPPIAKKMMVFIDDVNMPQLEEYGAQPPIELLRQFLDHGGWYNHTKDNVDFREVVDLLFLCAMGPPGGGRNPITQRFTRHFNSIAVPSFDESTLKKIFGTLMDWILTRGFNAGLRSLSLGIVSATVEVYETLVERLKPTPEKSHYTFNLRDVSKVFQGISMVNPNRIQDQRKLYMLWTHEVFRAFADRFIDRKDTEWFINELDPLMQKHFKMGYRSVVPTDEPTLFTDFMNEQGLYEEVEDIAEARKMLEDKLDLFNSSPAVRAGRMDLVVFNYVIEHVARICRVLKQPSGNVLLVGVGGSGRHSCTRLAAYLQEYEYLTVTMTKDYKRSDFHDDIRQILLKTGQNGFPVAFTLADTQITDETFLEDVSNLLNTGEVPGIWDSKQDKDTLENAAASLREVAKELGRPDSAESFLQLFVERCKKYLHIVLCFSPVGKTLRDRLRKFPSLVNCTTIDWFREWPEEGLRNVATRFLDDLDLTPDLRVSIRECFVKYHTQVRELGVQYLEEARQNTYVTPTSYLELLGTFSALLEKKRNELTKMRQRYDGGLDQLRKTEESVEVMKQELALMQPELVKKQKITDDLIVEVEKESKIAEAQRALVAVDEAAANETAAAAKKIKDVSQAQVDEAQPLVEQAEKAVQDLDPKQLQEVKALKAPPQGVKFVIEVVMTLLGGTYKPKPQRDPQTGKTFLPYWDHAKSVLLTGEFKNILLQAYPVIVDSAPEEQIEEVKEKMKDDMFKPESIKKTSIALVGVAAYVRAVVEYYKQNKIIKPLVAQAAVAQKEYDVAMASLKVKKEELRIVDEKLAKLTGHLDQVKADKQSLEDKVADTDTKLTRAKKLIEGLGGEKARYLQESKRFAEAYKYVVGDVVVSAGIVAYLGPFQNKYRQKTVVTWLEMCKEKKILGSNDFVFEKFLGNPISIQDWKIQQLPSDSFSVDNAIIMTNSSRYPLLVDPQQQANKWIRNMEGSRLVVVRPTDDGYTRKIAVAVREGRPCLLENVLEDVDPMLENVLLKRLVKEGTSYTVMIDEAVEWNANFKLYITTKLPRPHYRPEVSTKVNLINFMITPQGLQDQLLQEVMLSERREVEEKKNKMTLEAAENKARLKQTEDTILAILSAEGNILDSETAIQELDSAKIQSDKSAKRQEEIDAMEKVSNRTRMQFVPAAQHGAALFFCVTELANIDPMYQYSLQFYIALFKIGLLESEKCEEVEERIQNIRSTFQSSLYVKICRSLFAKDQLLFSFIMCLKLFDVDPAEVRWLLMGGFEQDKGLTANPFPFLPDLAWKYAWRASTQLANFKGFTDVLAQNEDWVRDFYESTEPLSIQTPPAMEKYKDLQWLIVVRCLRTDKIVPAVTSFVQGKLGNFYVEPPFVNLENIVEEIPDPTTAVIFVLSPGADPNAELDRVAEIKGMLGKKLFKLSLGQGQDVPARELIDDGKRQGNWVLLQNCHLYKDFMPDLARIIEDYSRDAVKESVHRDFRLWLTSLPSEDFPVAILQNGVKLVQEPPKGLKANLQRSYLSDPIADAKFFYSCNKPEPWRKMLFGLCFFHSLVQERRKFGPLGWNRPYEFNDTDMRISVRQLHMFINDNAEVPYEALTYLTGHCNYGGRVTDDWDRRCLMATLAVFFSSTILEDDYLFSNDTPEYFAPPHGEHESYVTYIQGLPMDQKPGIFGLHSNADITKDDRDARLLMDATLATQPRESSGGGGSALDPKAIVLQIAKEVHAKLPKLFDTEDIQAKYPILYNQSMNTVLLQECIRYNRLLAIVRKSLSEVQRAIKGEVVMSNDLEQVFNAIYDSKIPDGWRKRSYPSLKPFGSYINDLLDRLNFLQKWIDNGPPPTFWLSGFFFTQSFLTGVMQNYARKKHIEIDKLVWNFTVMHEPDYDTAPEDGCLIHGFYLEGAGWDHENKRLCESKPKELFVKFPILLLTPCRPEEVDTSPSYACPAYKTTDRRGVLSTTGHSTNFIMVMTLPRHPADSENHWVMRGTALFTSLEF